MTHTCSGAVAKLPQNQRNTHTNVSATAHVLFMLIASVGNLVRVSINLPIPVLDAAPYVSSQRRLKLRIEEIAPILFQISLGRLWYKS